MFYCHPLNEAPFRLSKEDTEQFREIISRIPGYIPLDISKDGGNKRKVTSRSSKLWSKPGNIDLISPVLTKLISKCISREWLERSILLLKLQSCDNNRIFLDSFEKIRIYKPELYDLDEGMIPKDITRDDQILLNHILPWLPPANDAKFKLIQDNKPNTLLVFPRFHFSYMDPGSYILPHLDHFTKLLSMMLYLPSEEQRGDDRLSTIFHQGNSSTIESLEQTETIKTRDWNDFRNSFEEIRPPFSENNLIVFTRTKTSWHSVDYPAQIKKGTRLSININLHISVRDATKRALLWNKTE